ncbi:MAG TPA: vanomycin resistance protein VanB [Desulfotomaculum sp.]|nr:vanomycin resistance protein VanB [Desulfotomaculum sp.]
MKLDIKIKILIVSVVLACLGATVTLGVSLAMEPETIISGVQVLGADLSGFSRDKGEAVLKGMEKDFIGASPLVIRYEDRAWQLAPGKIGLAIDRERVLDEALAVGRNGSPLERWGQYRKASVEGIDIPLYVKVDKASLEKELNSVAGEIAAEPEDARLKINTDDTVEVVPSREGVKIDVERAWQEIEQICRNPEIKPEIKLALIKSSPGVPTQEVADMGVDGLLASYTTTFNQADADRSYNIKIAALALDGIIIPPAEVFSFNGVVGSRSTEAGYKNAKVIINNELVDGLGGGVCQVSTTLYNAALLADMEIVDRVNHSIPVAYVPPGRDATVADNYLDFRFKNNTPHHIYMKTLVSPGRITVKLYGDTEYKKQVIIKTKVVETIPFKQTYEKDLTLREGEVKLKRKGNPGLRVVAERVLVENGLTRVESLPASLYHPVSQVVLLGPGVEPTGDLLPGEENKAGSREQPGEAVSDTVSGGIVPPAMQ